MKSGWYIFTSPSGDSCILVPNNNNICIKETKIWLPFKTWCSLSVPRCTNAPTEFSVCRLLIVHFLAQLQWLVCEGRTSQIERLLLFNDMEISGPVFRSLACRIFLFLSRTIFQGKQEYFKRPNAARKNYNNEHALHCRFHENTAWRIEWSCDASEKQILPTKCDRALFTPQKAR